MKHVTIIGGGIAGLATAYYLQREAEARRVECTYSLLEASPRFGGKIVTETANGFVVEGGPDSFITQKPWGLELCRDLGLERELIPCNTREQSVAILRNGKLVDLPRGLRLGVPTEFIPFLTSPLISWPGKLRMAMERLVPARTDPGDESVAAFVRRRLGREAAELFAGPLMAGIYVSDAERMSIESTFPMFPRMERKYGSLIKAMVARKKASRGTTPTPMFMTPRGGMQQLAQALLENLRGNLRTSTSVRDILRTEEGYSLALSTGESLTTNRVVLAVPAGEASVLLAQAHPGLAEALAGIRYVSTAAISLAYRGTDVPATNRPPGFGFVVPRSENRKILACTCSSTKFAHRADGRDLLLRVFVGGGGNEELVEREDDALLDLARHELQDILGLSTEPTAHWIYRWRAGNPQYDVGHLDRIEAIERMAHELGSLYLVGSSYRGIGIPDCVHSGRLAAESIMADAASAPPGQEG